FGNGYDAFIEFYCGGLYSTFSFNLVPETDFGSDSAITIEVYTDDNQKKAIKVTQKMEATPITVDITGCQWLQLKGSAIDGINKDYTWCILDNPVVKK
ncbi:MAG: NPCBM/NEW2 domain-containing protein, partial [Ruminococcus callidus]|nr:NPCBM/NEW2 domain-containing protein [Ruminococcus callidus]